MIIKALLFRRVIQSLVSRPNEIVLNRQAFSTAVTQVSQQAAALRNLSRAIDASFNELKQNWNSAAGRAFFAKFDNELLKHIDQYADKLQARVGALTQVRSRYEEVFGAADDVAGVRFN